MRPKDKQPSVVDEIEDIGTRLDNLVTHGRRLGKRIEREIRDAAKIGPSIEGKAGKEGGHIDLSFGSFRFQIGTKGKVK